MPLDLTIKFDSREVLRQLNSVQKRKLPIVIVRTLNKTATQVQAKTAREIRKDFAALLTISASGAKRALKVIRAHRGRLIASVIASGKPINVIDFGARKVGAGVSAAPAGTRRTFVGAFIARMPSGKRLVVRRKQAAATSGGTDSKGRQRKGRLPVRGLWGPSLPKIVLNAQLQRVMRRVADARWRINFDRELSRILRR